MPLLIAGECVGSLRAVEWGRRDWSEDDVAVLGDLAAIAGGELARRCALLERDEVETAARRSAADSRLAFDAAAIAMLTVSLEPASAGRVLRVNRAWCELLGRTEESLLGAHVADFSHPDDLEIGNHALAALVSGERRVLRRVEKRYVHADGRIVWGELTASVVRPGDGRPAYCLSLVEDITERKQAELELPAISNVLRRILSGEDARQAIAQAAVDIAGASSAHLAELAGVDHLTVTASAGVNLVGVEVQLSSPSATANAYLNGEALFLADPADSPLVSRQLLELSRARSIMWQPIFDHDGVIGVLVVCWADRVSDVSARAARAVALLTDETAVALAHHEALERLAEQATTDGLTGLPNRRAWEERLHRDLVLSHRMKFPLTLALLDMDRFKHFNDTRGHAAGDHLLRDFAQRAATTLREGDTIARWGGEEFAILLPDCPSESFAESILDRIREAVPDGQSCSIGYATWNGLETAEQLTKRADRALYRAKAMGRDRAVAAEPTAAVASA